MKQEDLLEAIGFADEHMLARSETVPLRRGSTVWRVVAAAAIVALGSVTALAAAGLLSRPVEGGDIVTEGTIAPVTFVGGDIYREPQVGLKVVMEVEVDADAPRTLEEIYHLKLSTGWTEDFRTGGGNGFEYNEYMTVWHKDGVPGEVRLRQTAVTGYVCDDEKAVDSLHELPPDTRVTAQVVTLAERQLLQVRIPAVELDGFADQNVLYFRDGETRLYWTDGRYMFRMDYPAWITDADAEQLLLTLYAEQLTPGYPEGWGELDIQKLRSVAYRDGNGTNIFNISGNATGAVYADGHFWLGESGAVREYDLQSGEVTVIRTWDSSLPRDMLLTRDGITFTDSKLPRWGRYRLTADGRAEALFEGVSLRDMWVENGAVYGIDEAEALLRIDLTSGEQSVLAEGVNKYYLVDGTLYVLPKNGQYFLRSDHSGELESVALTFRPIVLAVDGEELYFTVGGELRDGQRRYQVVCYRDGEETKLPVYGTRLRIIGGKLLYDADPDNALIEMYDLKTGETDLLQKNVFDYFVFEDRYVVFNYFGDGWGILDWSTGEMKKIDELKN